MKTAVNLCLGLCLAILVTSCGGPKGLSKSEMAEMIEKRIVSHPLEVLAGKDGGEFLLTKQVTVLSIDVTSCKYQGSGSFRGKKIWTYIYEAEGNMVVSDKGDSENGQMSGFEVSGRMRLSGEPGKWQLENINN